MEKLSLNLDEADKTSLSDYLKYKCLEKFHGINDTNLMYEGQPRYDDEITELARERNAQHYCSNSKHTLKPSDDDYRNKLYNPIVLTDAEQEWVDKAMTLIKKKGEFPYEWFDSEEKLNETQLPSQQEFYSELQKKSLSDEAYQHVLNVWEHFEFQTFQEYMEFYMCLDVVLLQCIFEKFRTSAQANYGNLDPVRYLSLPALAWDAALQMTNIELQLLTEEDGLYYILEKGVRGGITTATKRYAKETENSSIIYLDANNLYGWAMSQPLPYGGFKLLNDLPFDDDDLTLNISSFIKNKSEGVGYIFEVDVSYPVELHDDHSDLPFLPESFKPKEEMLSDEQKRLFKITYPNRTKYRTTEKLIPHLLLKSNYIAHHSILLQALDNGLKIEQIHRVIEFKEKPWLKEYIDFNTEKRTHATTKFMKDFYKLMNNAVYGKTMENGRHHKKHKLSTNGDVERKYVRLPNFYNSIEITDEISIIQFKYREVKLDKPIYVGLSILDISKTLMYNFQYEFMMKKFIKDGVKPQLCYMDTDSFIYDIPMNREERDSIILENQEEFDCSEYDTTHKLWSNSNKKIIGKMKNEYPNDNIVEFVGLRPKVYSIQTESGHDTSKVKGCSSKELNFDKYKQVLINSNPTTQTRLTMVSKHQSMSTVEKLKMDLAAFDDKRYILDDGIHTLPYGHYRQ